MPNHARRSTDGRRGNCAFCCAAGRGRFGPKTMMLAQRIAPAIDVRAAGSVAGLALQPAVTEGAARIIRTRMLGAEDARDARIVVTTEAGVGSLRAVGGGMRRAVRGAAAFADLIGGESCRYTRASLPSRSAQRYVRPRTARANRRTQFPPCGGNVVHDPDIRDSARAVTDGCRSRWSPDWSSRIVRPSASFETVVEPPFCCMCVG